MKKILIGFISFLLVGCQATERIDYSLTTTEKQFLHTIFSPQYPIDSVKVYVQRWNFWTGSYRGKYNYLILAYGTIPPDSIDPKVFTPKMDSLANFIVDFTNKANMPLVNLELFYRFKHGRSINFSYEMDKKNKPYLISFNF